MQVQVLYTKPTRSGGRIAHVKAGSLFGDVPCDRNIEPGLAELTTKLYRFQGRLMVTLKVQPQ